MSKFNKSLFKKGMAVTLISALFLFFSLCCSSDSMAENSMPSMSMSSEAMHMPQNDGMTTQVRLTNVQNNCRLCECKNVAAVKNDYSQKFNLSAISFKNDYSKFLTAALINSLNPESRLASNDESPSRSIQKSVPIFLAIKVLRL